MASIINALSSGTGGIVTAGDASGILQLQTANTAAVTIDGSQNVGIGTTSPANKLHVSDTTTSTVKTRTQASTGYVDVGMGGNSGVFDTTATDGIRLRMSGNDKVAIDGSTLALSGLQGIKFQATQSASSDANTLDDYEEGSFTPTFGAGGGTPPSTQTGTGAYVKIGRVVHLHGQINWSGSGSGGSNLKVDLPFVVVSDARGALALGIISGYNWAAGHQLTLVPELSASVAYILSKDPAGGGHIHRTYSDISTNGSFLFSFAGSYITSS